MISIERQAHMLQVGRTAERLARELFDWPEEKCRQMFLLGYVHDIGYEYADEQSDHPRIGGELLKEAGYPYWQEVRCHGIVDAPYESDELLLLNIADMLTNGAGEQVKLSDRFVDIERRYGAESKQYRDAARLSAKLSEKIAPSLSQCSWLEQLWDALPD